MPAGTSFGPEVGSGVRVAVEDRLFQALAILRVVLLGNALILNLLRAANFDRPRVGLAIVVAMLGWTAVVTLGYSTVHRRRWWLLVADLAVSVAAIVTSVAAKGTDLRATVPGFWVMAAMLAWAVHWGWRGGLVASVVLVVADFGVREEFTQANYGNTFLLLIGGPIIGFVSDSLKQMAAERDRAQRAAAVAAERARLARAVHDGVLQVLALVQRTGRDEPGEFGRLAQLAGEQEAALRALIRRQDTVVAAADEGSTLTGAAGVAGAEVSEAHRVDLVDGLEQLVRSRGSQIQFSGPGGAVAVTARVAAELIDAVAECLSNVARHVGSGAPAWVLLESSRDAVVVTVRDAGPGIPEGRLATAESEGRLGISTSIRGRLAELGGTATLTTSGDGTEWELMIPTRRAR